ncbi:uncharacterized protein BDR25DRAFT_395739 [Lindgomyces ingoldianus]|uniref:Uncharacterized protein n=1 Tax=Lindgomyces ingoldianus TaxID=673940 RepID=A0ACB6QI37_9PLEO|nr:uncharacterized protein BDR25DRAFT_395739 [Lindgomyces ingoldianus]KAF2466599.1 hypothetical protein BDR25DRAFT_395739 [Lindgomyces ingoldianus]
MGRVGSRSRDGEISRCRKAKAQSKEHRLKVENGTRKSGRKGGRDPQLGLALAHPYHFLGSLIHHLSFTALLPPYGMLSAIDTGTLPSLAIAMGTGFPHFSSRILYCGLRVRKAMLIGKPIVEPSGLHLPYVLSTAIRLCFYDNPDTTLHFPLCQILSLLLISLKPGSAPSPLSYFAFSVSLGVGAAELMCLIAPLNALLCRRANTKSWPSYKAIYRSVLKATGLRTIFLELRPSYFEGFHRISILSKLALPVVQVDPTILNKLAFPLEI